MKIAWMRPMSSKLNVFYACAPIGRRH